MCEKASLQTISQSDDNGYIAYCTGCERYNLVFQNIFLLLSKEELRGLGQMIDDGFGVYQFSKPIGSGKLISFQTPLANLYFAFTPDEYEEFKRMVNEALLVFEARELIEVENK